MHFALSARLTAILLGLAAAVSALAQDTSIAYQGYVTDNGAIISGPTNYTMSFRLYASASGGAPLATIPNQIVTVTDSLFSTALAFPPSVWSGADRWLEVQIGAQVLTPRQKIRWSPYAVYALSAGSGGGGVGGGGTANQVPKWTAATTLGNSVITETSGNIGINESVPLAALHLQTLELGLLSSALENDEIIVEAEDAALGLYSTNGGSWASAIALKEVSGGAIVDTWGIVRRTSNVSNPSSLHFTYGPSDNYAANPAMMVLSNGGNVGIGLATPAQKLSVAGTIQSTTGGFMFPDGSTQTTAAASGLWTASGTHIFNSNSGNVGIGTNAPAEELHVLRNQAADTFVRIENLSTSTSARAGLLLRTQGSAPNFFNQAGIFLGGGDDNRGIDFFAPGTMRLDASGFDFDGPLGGVVNVFGRVGTAPKIQLSGGFANPSSGTIGVRNTLDGEVIRLLGGGANNAGEIQLFRPGQANATIRLFAADSANQGAAIDLKRGNGTNGIYLNAEELDGRGAAVSLYNHVGTETIKLDADFDNTGVGRIRTQVLEITGADLAEQFPVSETIEPGMLVAIDPVNEGKLCLARGAYNRAVAGVASGANDFSVGAILGSRPESEDGPPIALAGRVYVWVDADVAPIKPGDMLTTSNTPGHAMKVKDYAAAQGAIIGKAMGSLESGKGLVLVLVNLQ